MRQTRETVEGVEGGQVRENRGRMADGGVHNRDERGEEEGATRKEKWLSDARASSRFSRHVEMRARLDDDDGDQICSGIRNRWDGTMGWE